MSSSVEHPDPALLWRQLFQVSGDAMAVLEGSGVLEANPAFLRLFGMPGAPLSPEAAPGLCLEDLAAPLQPDGSSSRRAAGELIASADAQGSCRSEWHFRRRLPGTEGGPPPEFLAEVSLTRLTPPNQPPLYHLLLRDVTERRRQEIRLSENAERLQRMLENLPTGAVYFEGETVYLNRAAEKITGYTRAELRTADDWFQSLYGEQAAVCRTLFELDREAGFPMPVKVPIHRKDGKLRIIEFSAHRDQTADGVISVMTDITDQVRMSEAEVHEQRILELISGGNPLREVLRDIAHLCEVHLQGCVAALYTLSDTGDSFTLTGSPHLPTAFAEQAGSVPLPAGNSAAGNHGGQGILAALDESEPLISSDITVDPRWGGGGVAAQQGLRACWAQAVRIASGQAVGVIAFFFPRPCLPDKAELHLLTMAAHIVALAIQRRRSDEALRRANDELEARVRERTAELRRANRELEAERARLETVLRQMPAGVAIIEIGTGRLLMMNEQVSSIWRESPDAAMDEVDCTLEKLDGTLYSEEELPLRAFHTGEALEDFEFAIRRCDGTRGVVLASATPLKSAEGVPCAMVVTLKDITDLKNTEEALRRLHDELELQVQERTAELARANRSLREEVAHRERAEQVSRGQTEALIRTLDALTTQFGTEAVLENVLNAIYTQLGAEALFFWQRDPATDTMSVRYGYVDGNKIDQAFCDKEGIVTTVPCSAMPNWVRMREDRRPKLLYDIATETGVMNRDILLRHGVKAVLGVPLFRGDEMIGCFSIMTRVPRKYREEEIELAQALAHQVTMALQLERLAAHSREGAILQERNRMAREIHDTLAQGFTSIIIHLQLAEAAASCKPETVVPTLLKARDIARESLAEARRSVWALRPNALEGSQLADGLRRLIDSMTAPDAIGGQNAPCIKPRLEVTGIPRALSAETDSHLLRIGQEALNNAFKYAGASEICIYVHFEPSCLTLTIRDNGCGFTPGASPLGSGFGHTGMHERIQALKGTLTIESAPGQGTTITARVPI